jgi:hypothetical protein
MFTLCDERKEAKSCCTCFVHFQKLTAVAFTSYLLVVNFGDAIVLVYLLVALSFICLTMYGESLQEI